MMDTTALATYVPDSTLPIVSGCVAFGSTLALSTLAQKLMGISTATKVVPSVWGMATVCLASLASQRAALFGHEWHKDPNAWKDSKKRQKLLLGTSSSSSYRSDDNWQMGEHFKIPLHDIRVCMVGLLAFKLLGGRFWAIAPSSFTTLGSFSRWSLPCTEKYATSNQRTMLEQMGKKWGCHTCGSHMLLSSQPFRFVGDHMPPKSVAEHMNKTWWRQSGLWRKVQFRFYPQCVHCSNTQGSILGKASSRLMGGALPSFMRAASLQNSGGGKLAHFHGSRFRINHLTGGVLAGATVWGATDRQIANGNPKRFKTVQRRVEKAVKWINI